MPTGAGDGGASPLDFRDEVARELRMTYRAPDGRERARRVALVRELRRPAD